LLSKNRKLLAWTLVLLLLGQLSACGFRLRGQIDVPEELKLVHIVGSAEFAPLTLELKKVLQRSGTRVLPSTAEAESIITISNEQLRKRVLSVDAQGRAAEYELIYTLNFTVTKTDAQVIVPDQKIELSRDYRFDPDNVLAKDAEEAQIRKDMISFAVRQMMRRIDSHLKSGRAAGSAT
jgi:LPS-assembly lipoprotein